MKRTITNVNKQNREKKLFDLYICSCSIIVDVSYSSVVGDIVWIWDGLSSECISSISYGVFFLQCLYCIAILVGLYYTSRGSRRGESGLGGVIFERGGRF